MNRIFALSFYLLLANPIVGLGQVDTLRIFYDADWKEISDFSKAEYRRVAYPGDDGYWYVKDFYKTGQLQMSGAFIEKEMQRRHGKFEWFYLDGKSKQKATYSLGAQVGEDFQYYPSGQLDTYRKFDERGRIIDEGLYQENGSKSIFEEAEFPGGTKAMYRYLKKNTHYPTRQLSGKVIISFVVNTDGSLADIEVLEWSEKEFVRAAVQVVESMPNWKPALRDQKPVRTKYNLPILFRP